MSNSTSNSTVTEVDIYYYTDEGRPALTLLWFAVAIGPPALFCILICFLVIARHRYKYVREHSPILLFLKSAAAIAIYSYLFVIWFCPLLNISPDWPFLWMTILPLLYITPHVTRLYNITLVHLTIILKSRIIRGSKDLSPLLNAQGQPASTTTPATPNEDKGFNIDQEDVDQIDKEVIDYVDVKAELLTRVALLTSSRWFYALAFGVVVAIVSVMNLPMLIMLFIPANLYTLIPKFDIISYYAYAILLIVGILNLLVGIFFFILMLAIRVKEVFYIRLTTFLSLGCLTLTIIELSLYVLFNLIWGFIKLPNRVSFSIYCILFTFISWTIFIDVLITCGIPIYMSIKNSVEEMKQSITMQKQEESEKQNSKSYIQEYEELERLIASESVNFLLLSARQKLLAILMNKDYLKRFRLFAKTEWSVENVLFYEFWVQFRKQITKEIHSANPNYELLFGKFAKMYDLFLSSNATLALNIPSSVMEQVVTVFAYAQAPNTTSSNSTNNNNNNTIPFLIMQYKEELPSDAFEPESNSQESKGRTYPYLKIQVLKLVTDKVMVEVIGNLLDTFSRFYHTSDMEKIIEMYRVNVESGATLWRADSEVGAPRKLITTFTPRVVNHASQNEIKVAL